MRASDFFSSPLKQLLSNQSPLSTPQRKRLERSILIQEKSMKKTEALIILQAVSTTLFNLYFHLAQFV